MSDDFDAAKERLKGEWPIAGYGMSEVRADIRLVLDALREAQEGDFHPPVKSDVERAKADIDAYLADDPNSDFVHPESLQVLRDDHDRLTRENAELIHALEQEQRTRAQALITRRTDA